MEKAHNTTQNATTARPRSFAAACLLAVILGGTALANTGANTGANPGAEETADPAHAAENAPFEEQFTAFETLPDEPETPDHAVDITEIEPPVEPEAKPEPEPDSAVTRTLGSGVASYYGRRFHGRKTANGERFNMNAMTAAHKTLPFGTKVKVTNRRNGRSVVVRINDRGPFIRGRTIDLSRAAASKIGLIQTGHASVKLDIVS